MKATGVIVRFLSLLDVALILLGVLMITLMQAQLRSDAKQGNSSADEMAKLADVDFVYLYAGCGGAKDGKCYLLSNNRKIGQEVRTDTPDDIQVVFKERNPKKRANQVVMLLFSKDDWDAAWDQKKLAEIEQVWKIKVVPVYDVPLSLKENP